MARQSNSISLPWTRRGGILTAEFGAVFTVELAEGGWQCSMENGECVEVLGTGLKSQRQGKARAEEHATRLAAKALAEKTPRGRSPRRTPPPKPAGRPAASKTRESQQGPGATAPIPLREATNPGAQADDRAGADKSGDAITFDEIEDGCIMGRVGGACWAANEKEVVWTNSVDPTLQAKVQEAAARHYRAKRDAQAAERAAAREDRKAAKQAAREMRRAAAAEQRAAKKAERQTEKKATKTPAEKAATKKAATKKAATKKTAAKKTTTAKKATAKRSEPAAAETAASTPAKKSAKKAAKKAGRGRRGKAAGKDAAKEEDAVTAKKADKPAKGPIAWSTHDGELRGTAAHGTFVVQPEGMQHALYFYEPGGQSRHLQSGTLCDVRKVAEEMAARGQPAPASEKLSPEMEAQMLQMFVSGAVGGKQA